MKRFHFFSEIWCEPMAPMPHSMSNSVQIIVSPLKTAHARHRLVSKDIEWGMGVRMKKTFWQTVGLNDRNFSVDDR